MTVYELLTKGYRIVSRYNLALKCETYSVYYNKSYRTNTNETLADLEITCKKPEWDSKHIAGPFLTQQEAIEAAVANLTIKRIKNEEPVNYREKAKRDLVDWWHTLI